MKFSRRKFIAAVPVVAGGLTLTERVFGQRDRAGRIEGTDALSKLSWDSFLPFVNTDFKFGAGKSAIVLTLVEMKDSRPLASRARRRGQENFVLKFAGAAFEPLEQKTYPVNHFNLGDFDLFIGPVKSEKYGMIYEAIINHVVS